MATIDIVADRLEQLTKRFESIENQLKDGSNKFGSFGQNMATIKSQLEGLREAVDLKISSAVNPLNTDMADMKQQVQHLASKQSVKDVKDTAEKVDKRLWAIVAGLLLNAIGVIVALSMALNNQKGG
jgi:archaellum component FlaC